MSETCAVSLNNYKIRSMVDKNGRSYYLVIDNDNENNNTYFCFSSCKGFEIINDLYFKEGDRDEFGLLKLKNQVTPLSIEYTEVKKDERTSRKLLSVSKI